MSASTDRSSLVIALIGNPNTGKSTLFTALAGVRQRVGNYPGVTVEKKVGHGSIWPATIANWSICPARTAWPRARRTRWWRSTCCSAARPTSSRPSVVLSIVDASNLERNLYLVSQVLELGLPTVVALNMVDVARVSGVKIDVGRCWPSGWACRSSKCRPIGGSASIDLEARAVGRHGRSDDPAPGSPFPPEFQQRSGPACRTAAQSRAALPLPALPGRAAAAGHDRLSERYVSRRLEAARWRLKSSAPAVAWPRGRWPVPAIEAHARYAWVARMLEGVVTRPRQRVAHAGRSDRSGADPQAAGARSCSRLPCWWCFRRCSWPPIR